MRPLHPYVLLRCDACGMLVEPCLSVRTSQDLLAHEPAPSEFCSRASAAPDASEPEHDEAAPLSSGLLLFSRDGELRYEEPPLCARCSVAIGVTALFRWAEEEEEG